VCHQKIKNKLHQDLPQRIIENDEIQKRKKQRHRSLVFNKRKFNHLLLLDKLDQV
jgi:hypothetical protein